MAAQTRTKFTQTVTLGEWQYKFTISRVVNPFPLGTVPESVASTTAIPNYIFVTPGRNKESFDLAKLGAGDKVENVTWEVMDNDAGNWLSSNIFTSVADNVVYQIQYECDKGTGTLGTLFFGEIDLRTLVFEPDYFDVANNLRKQKVTFTASDIFHATLQAMPFGDSTVWYIGSGPALNLRNSISGYSRSTSNRVLPTSLILQGSGNLGVMNSFPNYKSSVTAYQSNLLGGVVDSSAESGNDVYAAWEDVVTWVTTAIANRSGYSNAAIDDTIAFSHLQFSYGGSLSAAGTTVSDIAKQLALQRTGMLSVNSVEVQYQPALGLVPVQDYSLAKEGTAWDGFLKLLECFIQYGLISFNDATSTVTLTIKSPLSGSLAAFIATEPKLGKLKYTPYGFAARSVSARIINPSADIVNSATNAGTPTVGLPTNNIAFTVPFPNASIDISTQLTLGTFYDVNLSNQVTVFHNGPDYTATQCIDNNANGEMKTGGAFLKPIRMNQGFGNSLGTVTCMTLTDAIARGLFSLFCGQSPTDGTTSATSAPLEIVEFEMEISQYALTNTAGVFVDTRGIDTGLLKTIPITTDSLHTFIITSVDVAWFGLKRIANVVAVRSVT